MNCKFSHARLETDEVFVLAIKARQQVCRYGSDCPFPYCFLGHHCPYDSNCHFRAKGTCRFGDKLHGIDKRMTHVLVEGEESYKRQKVSHD